LSLLVPRPRSQHPRSRFLLARWVRGGLEGGGRGEVGTHLAAAVATDWAWDGGAAGWAQGAGAWPRRSACSKRLAVAGSGERETLVVAESETCAFHPC
jgi:hypothetical protein